MILLTSNYLLDVVCAIRLANSRTQLIICTQITKKHLKKSNIVSSNNNHNSKNIEKRRVSLKISQMEKKESCVLISTTAPDAFINFNRLCRLFLSIALSLYFLSFGSFAFNFFSSFFLCYICRIFNPIRPFLFH